MTIEALSNSASINPGSNIIELGSPVSGLTNSLMTGYIIQLNGHLALVNTTLNDSQIELRSSWNHDAVTNGTLYGVATLQGFARAIEDLNLTNDQLQTELTAALQTISGFKTAAEKDTVKNSGTVLENDDVKAAAYKDVGTDDGKVLPAEALSAYIKGFISTTDAATARDKIEFNEGLSPLELSKLMNPMVDLFKKNKGLHHYAGTATFTSGPGTYRDRYGDLQTSAENELREEEDGFLFYNTYTNYALYSDTAGRDPATLPETNAVQQYSLSAPDVDGWCDFVENTEASGRYIPPRANGEIYEADDPCFVSLEVKPLGVGVDRYFAIGFLIDDAGKYAWAIYDVVAGTVVNSDNHIAVGIKPTSDGFICWLSGKMESARHPGSQLRLCNTTTSWSPNYQGDGTSGLKVRRLMITKAYGLVPYIQTTDAAVTRTRDLLMIPSSQNIPRIGRPFTIYSSGVLTSTPSFTQHFFRSRLQDKDGTPQDSYLWARLTSTGQLGVRLGLVDFAKGVSVTTDEVGAFSVAIVSDGLNAKVFWNKEKVMDFSAIDSQPNLFYSALLLRCHEGAGEYADGHQESFKIWDYALSEAAINAL